VNRAIISKITRQSSLWTLISCINFMKGFCPSQRCLSFQLEDSGSYTENPLRHNRESQQRYLLVYVLAGQVIEISSF
jgi:hypothetical protein